MDGYEIAAVITAITTALCALAVIAAITFLFLSRKRLFALLGRYGTVNIEVMNYLKIDLQRETKAALGALASVDQSGLDEQSQQAISTVASSVTHIDEIITMAHINEIITLCAEADAFLVKSGVVQSTARTRLSEDVLRACLMWRSDAATAGIVIEQIKELLATLIARESDKV